MDAVENFYFGRYLKAIRLEKGITLKEVSRETRIGIYTLLLLEREDHANLPPEVFVKGFIRAYAKTIDADVDAAVRRYLVSLDLFKKNARIEADLIKSNIKFWPRLLLALGLLSCIIAVSVFTISILRQTPETDSSLNPQVVGADEEVIEPKVFQKPDLSEERSEKTIENLLLKIITLQKTKIKIIIDDQSPKEYSLNPGDHLELEARSSFNLLIGNAGGVKLFLNEKILEVPGRSGQVVNIKIP